MCPDRRALAAWSGVELLEPLAGGARNQVFLARRGGQRLVVRRSGRPAASLDWDEARVDVPWFNFAFLPDEVEIPRPTERRWSPRALPGRPRPAGWSSPPTRNGASPSCSPAWAGERQELVDGDACPRRDGFAGRDALAQQGADLEVPDHQPVQQSERLGPSSTARRPCPASRAR
jgi:hypothetical protein